MSDYIQNLMIRQKEVERVLCGVIYADPDGRYANGDGSRIKADVFLDQQCRQFVETWAETGDIIRAATEADASIDLVKWATDGVLGDRFKYYDEILRLSNKRHASLPLHPTEPETYTEFTWTDLGNAERLVAAFGDRLRYAKGLGWLTYDGRRWVRDDEDSVTHAAKQIPKHLAEEAAQMLSAASNKEDRKNADDLWNFAKRSMNVTRIKAMVKLAKSDPIVRAQAEDFDADPWLFNVQNGTIDLRTGELRPHSLADMITMLANVSYDAEAECPRWIETIGIITDGDENLALYMQKTAGYTTTGLTDDKALYFHYGATGDNGKSTYMEAFANMLGDYSQKTDVESLMARNRGNSATPYIAALKGARMVWASEIEEGRKLNEALIKDLTGGDTLTGRWLRQNPINFLPTHKLWLYGNYKPKISGTDGGIWGRVRLLPFNYRFTGAAKRKQSVVLAEFAEEAAGILNWCLEGLRVWREEGLKPPKSVSSATAEYRTEQDLFLQFLEECTRRDALMTTTKDELFKAFRAWGERAGERDVAFKSKRWVTVQMKRCDYQESNDRRNWTQLGLVS